MFTIDERYRGLPVTKEQVIALHQSINAPHLAIPGKQAGPAQAFVVGLRGSSGFAVFIYLYLEETQDCAVYASGRLGLGAEQYRAEEGEALAFVESMGFMMDDAHFPSLLPEHQEEILKTLPVFFKDPQLAPLQPNSRADEKRTVATNLGRLLAAF